VKILNISYSDKFGGAAKSAYRIHNLLNTINDVKSDMLVVKKISKDKNIFNLSKKDYLLFKFKNYFGMLLSKFDRNINPKSYNFFDSPFLNYINNSNYDLINIHWVNAEALSIDDVKKINKPFVITMHDMWWICGSENYLQYNNNAWKKGIFRNFYSDYNFKKKLKINPLAIVCPSKWLMRITKKSPLYTVSKVVNIAYPINQDVFYPQKINYIKKFKIKKNKKIKIFFAVFGDSNDKRKGIDLLVKSLNLLNKNEFELVVASKKFFDIVSAEFIVHNLEYINSEKNLSKIYSLCDIVVISSRIDNLPNVALEAQSCGKPLVGYNVGGISDIIKNNINGFLIKPFDFTEFAKKLNILITNKDKRQIFSKNALNAKKKWSENEIKKKYKNFLLNLK
jgi:glycosyltransferase involved in cell wall biosynthesis